MKCYLWRIAPEHGAWPWERDPELFKPQGPRHIVRVIQLGTVTPSELSGCKIG